MLDLQRHQQGCRLVPLALQQLGVWILMLMNSKLQVAQWLCWQKAIVLRLCNACAKYGGFYLGSIGGVAAKLALDAIKKVEVLEYPELGMEAVWKIEVEDFPAFIVMDDKGNDFFKLD